MRRSGQRNARRFHDPKKTPARIPEIAPFSLSSLCNDARGDKNHEGLFGFHRFGVSDIAGNRRRGPARGGSGIWLRQLLPRGGSFSAVPEGRAAVMGSEEFLRCRAGPVERQELEKRDQRRARPAMGSAREQL